MHVRVVVSHVLCVIESRVDPRIVDGCVFYTLPNDAYKRETPRTDRLSPLASYVVVVVSRRANYSGPWIENQWMASFGSPVRRRVPRAYYDELEKKGHLCECSAARVVCGLQALSTIALDALQLCE